MCAEKMPLQIGLLRLDRPLTEAERDTLSALLPPTRRQRLKGPPSAEVLCAYGLLLALLRERYGWRTLPDMETDAHGKPCFPAYPGVHFSLSHTEGAAAAAVSAAPVGVDIQRVRHGADRPRRLAGTQTSEDFFADWVRWEARAKRVGGGLLTMLRREPPLSVGEAYTPLPVFPGYAAGVAAGMPVPPEAVRLLTPDDLLLALS